MIYYSTDTWRNQIFRFHGTVWSRGVWWKVVIITAYTGSAYYYCVKHESNIAASRKNTLGATLSFLLVFRANNAYSRYMQGRTYMTNFYCDLRELVSCSIIHMPGGQHQHRWRWREHFKHADKDVVKDTQPDMYDTIVSEERTHVIRWVLALAVCFQLHARLLDEGFNHGELDGYKKWLVDWDRYRLRHLMTADEFKKLDQYTTQLSTAEPDIWTDLPFYDLDEGTGMFQREPPSARNIEKLTTVPVTRAVVIVIYKLNEILLWNMNDFKLQNKKYGVSERFLPQFGKLTRALLESIQLVTQCVSTPLPFPYFHLCKILLILYFLSFPFFIQQELGFYANVAEFCFLTMALLGVDAIATELENPFGDDANDLDMYEKIATLEHEIMFFLKLCNDKACEDNFIWMPMPQQLAAASVSPIPNFLALRTQVKSNGESGSCIWAGEIDRVVSVREAAPIDDDENASSASDDS